MKVTIFTILLFVSSYLFSQNIYPDCWDGCMYIMLNSKTQEIPSKGKEVNINDFDVLKVQKEKYGIYAIEKINYFSSDVNMRNIFKVHFTKAAKIDELIELLSKTPTIKYAEKAPIIQSLSINDADYLASENYRWHLDVINAEAAWGVPRQINTVKIAVIDKAMDMDHPDLVAQWDTLYDICDNDFDTNPPSTVDDDHPSWSHGTHTSGLAGATTNNGVGIASVGYDVRLMGIKITNNEERTVGSLNAPSGSMISAYEAVVWAADNGADIISMSWGSKRHSVIKQEIMNYAAVTKNCLLVAGAGNDGENVKFYPAALNNVIAVAGTDGDDKLSAAGMPPLFVSSGSNFGDWVDVCAPGFGKSNSNDQVKVYSTSFNDSYMMIGGTSMATPIVASLAALIKSINPELSAEAIENIIKSTCDDNSAIQIDNDRKNGVGAGRINAEAAANAAYASINQIIPSFSANRITIIEGQTIDFTNLSSGNDIVSYKWTFEGANTNFSIETNPSGITYTMPGTYDVTLKAITSTDTFTLLKQDYINVRTGNSMWQQQASAFEVSYRSIYNIAIANENIAWAVAFDPAHEGLTNEFTRTNNGGDNWVSGKIEGNNIPTYLKISNIFPINFTKAYACMHTNLTSNQTFCGGVYVTNNGGDTWTLQDTTMFTNAESYPVFVHFYNDNNGVCVGNPIDNEFEIYVTADGGTNWTKVNNGNIPDAQAAENVTIGKYDYYQNIVWFATDKGRIYKSIDKGNTWTVVQTGLSFITKMTFANENIGIAQKIARNMLDTYIVTYENKITTDGGDTWTSFTPGNGIRKGEIDFVPGNSNMLISVGTDGEEFETVGSSYSEDLGLTWEAIDQGVYYSTVTMYNDNVGFAGGLNSNAQYGGMFKWDADSNNVGSIFDLNNSNCHIYPNPALQSINVEIFDIQSFVQIKMFSISGKQVYNSERIISGNYKEKIDIEKFSNGVYLLSIIKDNEQMFRKFIKK